MSRPGEALQADYDELQDLAEHHALIRAALGIGDWQEWHFDWTRIWRNVRRVRAETMSEINRRVLRLGHQIVPEATERVSSHRFRHSFAIHSLRGGMDIVSLQQAMGHRCIISTVRYLTPDLTRPGKRVDVLAALGVQP